MNTVKTSEIEKPGFTEFKLKSNQQTTEKKKKNS